MYTKTIVMTKHSCKGKEFTCTKVMSVMDDADREELRRKRLMQFKFEREKQQRLELHRAVECLNPTTMRKIMAAYDEYMENEKYY